MDNSIDTAGFVDTQANRLDWRHEYNWSRCPMYNATFICYKYIHHKTNGILVLISSMRGAKSILWAINTVMFG